VIGKICKVLPLEGVAVLLRLCCIIKHLFCLLSTVSFLHPVFQGLNPDNDTLQLGLDFQRMIRIHHMLYIAASVMCGFCEDFHVLLQKLTWKTKPQDMEKCALRGKNNDECYNYIKVLVSRNDQTLFACGTNAFNPTCRNYKMETLEQDGEELLGQARCPFESKQSNVALFADGNLYSATMADFLASDAVIYRSLGERSPVLRTVKYDSKWLREPHFHHAIEYGKYVYFFFSEIAVEYTTLGKVVYSRVARVCKNDMGGSPRVLEKYWTSFLKARLNCSIPGDSFFYFDVLQSVSNVVQSNRYVITGSGVCAFYMDDIEKVFSGKFKEQKTTESIWSPVPDERVPKPRPGSCAGEESAASYKSSNTFPDETLSFIKSYPLMDDAVPSVSEKPWFTKTTSRYKLTQIAVDTEAGPDKNYTVVFLGSEDGKILKVLASTTENSTRGSLLLEEVDVYNPSKCNKHREDRRILGLELDKEHHALFAAFSSCVIRVPLSRCQNYGRCKKTCLRSQDPYCIWLKRLHWSYLTCFSLSYRFMIYYTTPTSSSAINQGYPKVPGRAEPDNGQDSLSPFGVRRQPEADKSSQSVHFTLLIACVVVAFALGAFLSGLLVSCYCSHVSHKTKKLNKEPEATIPHALSLRSLAKLNGLLDGPGRDEKMEVSSPKLYHTLISNVKEQQVNGNTRASSGNGKGDSHHAPELSGLPTPESTPELPVKSMKAFRNQWEKNQNCNNAKDVRNPIMTGSRPNSGVPVQVFQFPNSLALSSSGQVLGGSSHLHLEDRKIPNAERIKTQAYSCYPQKMVDVNTLDELLKHLHEANMSNSAGKSITMINAPHLTNNGQIPFANRVQPKIPDTESAPYYSSSTLPRDSLTRRLDVPPDMPPPQSTLERSSRHPSQRHSMCSAPKMINGCIVSRQHSFNHRSGQPPPPLLARMNSTGSTSDSHRPFHPNGYLSRQHSYNEQEAVPRGGIVRRTCSLKPDVPPKPMFIPATSPVNSSNQFNY
uniref:Semaphorin 6Cb n=1 Tax=Erpetoichthys calabaricus TaxID=27687 RepID=A0A8C4RD95_ERPCA